MLRNAQTKILVADHTKFEGNANILFEGMEDLSVIITDQKLPEEMESFAARRKIEVLYSPE